MLTKMELRNFLSFKELTVFDFNATRYEILENQNQIDNILKGALFIGPNAAGKSNALDAICLLLLLMYGDKEVDLSSYHCVFSKDKDMNLTYIFDIDDSEIQYDIQHDNENDFLTEKLTLDGKPIINRIGTEGVLELDRKIHRNDLSNDKLFLRGLDLGDAFAGEGKLKKFIDFLSNSIFFDIILKNVTGKVFGSALKAYRETEYEKDINKFFEDLSFGFNVEFAEHAEGEGIKAVTTDKDGNAKKNFYFKRTFFPYPFPVDKESLGNQIVFKIMELLFFVSRRGGMLILDEFSSGLHNDLEELIIRYFMKNSKRSQLFLTSHSTNLISNYVMRPDQIYIVEFRDKNGSTLKRISDFRPREAQNLEKMYLSGVFEGLPNYEKV